MKFIEICQVISKVLGVFADGSKLPDTDKNGLQFWAHENDQSVMVRFCTEDNMLVDITMDPDNLTMLSRDPTSYLSELTMMVIGDIANRRKVRASEGSIIIPSRNQIIATTGVQ